MARSKKARPQTYPEFFCLWIVSKWYVPCPEPSLRLVRTYVRTVRRGVGQVHIEVQHAMGRGGAQERLKLPLVGDPKRQLATPNPLHSPIHDKHPSQVRCEKRKL
jgi:hypothetical protein